MKKLKSERILAITAAILSIIYIILSLINIYNQEISTSVFHTTYEKWKDSTYFTSLVPYQLTVYIHSIAVVLPHIAVCIISIFSEKFTRFRKLKAVVLSFLFYILANHYFQDLVHQSTCSDDWVQISLISKLQNILMILNIVSFLLICCSVAIEIHTKNYSRVCDSVVSQD